MKKNYKSWDPFGKALKSYFEGNSKASLGVILEEQHRSEIDIQLFFRDGIDMPEIEEIALDYCKGKVLDVGAGAGSHSLALLEMGHEVVAIDVSDDATLVMKSRSIKAVECSSFLNFKSETVFDTLLFLMNGIGIVENLEGLKQSLQHAHSLSHSETIIILDSSDPSLLDIPEKEKKSYPGIVNYQLEFEGTKGAPYQWLYVDFDTLRETAKNCGWESQMIYEDESGNYLACLSKG